MTFIIAQLIGNPNFATTNPTLAQIGVALKALTDAMALADPTAREAAVAAGRTTLEQMLDDLADNLENTASMSDPATILIN